MFPKILTQIFGSRNDRLLKTYRRTVESINALEPRFEKLSDAELRAKTDEFRQRCAAGVTLDELLPEAFAVAREASKRTLKMRHFDVQLIGGIALHQGKIAEMRTGEGKTLMATLPVYLNALAGKGVHVVTVNDYLARRDAEWMGRIYAFLGLTVGVNVPGMEREEKQAAYAADVTYGTNNEFGFDYLRDNMVLEVRDRVARGLNYAIVDEVDSILIDEARTPLIISGQAEDHTEMYVRINAIVPQLKKQIGEEDVRTGEGVIDAGDFTVDEKSHQIYLTEAGHENAERLLGENGLLAEGASLYDPANITLDAPRLCGAAGQPPVPPRPALRGAERRGHHRRRIHRPPDDGPALERRPAPGGGGQGRRADPEREPDAGLGHLPELLPHVRQARRHDRHGRHRSLRIPGDLRPGDGGHPAQQADHPQGRQRPHLQDRQGKVRRGHQRHPRLLRARPAGAGGHDVDRELRADLGPADEGQAAAPGAQRQAARQGSRDRGPGRAAEDDHHRHQHGRPRHRHRARRQCRKADPVPGGRRQPVRRRKAQRARRSSRTNG